MKKENWMKWDIDSLSSYKTKFFLLAFKNKDQALGSFLHLVSLLYERADHRLDLDDIFFQVYEAESGVPKTEIELIIRRLIEAKLFFLEGETKLGSYRVDQEVITRKDHAAQISAKRSEVGKAGVAKRWEENKTNNNSILIANDSKALQTIANDSQSRLDKSRLDKIRSYDIQENNFVVGNESSSPQAQDPAAVPPKIPLKQKSIRKKFDPEGKKKFGDWVYLSEDQIAEVQKYYERKGLTLEEFREAIIQLDSWFAQNPHMREKRLDDGKALKGWPLDRALQRRTNLLNLERQEQLKNNLYKR